MGTVVPFPIRAQRRLIADLQHEASAAGDPALIERCLRSRVRVYGELLADKGIAPDLIEAETRGMEWLLLGSVSEKPKRRRKAE